MKIQDLQQGSRIFALFVGRSGSGKSGAAASFPKPFHELDFDYRADGILGAINEGWLNGEGIEYTEFNPRGGFEPVEKLLSQWDMMRIAGSFNLRTIGIGSLGSMTRLLTSTSIRFQNPNATKVGGLKIESPQDYKFETNGTHQVFDFIRAFPCNIICTAHITDKWGKKTITKENQYLPADVIGEKLSIRDNLGENVQSYFSNVFRFSREEIKGNMRYFVEFSTDLAKNTFGIPPGRFDITGKEFHPFLQDLILSIKDGSFKKPEQVESGGFITI